MIRRRPIPRFRSYPEFSQHYETLQNGAVRKYRDGREVCTDTPQGWREYAKRVQAMVQRQNFRCSRCMGR